MRQKFNFFHFIVLVLISLQNAGAAIELQSHQKLPVEDLLTHPDKKGLLLYRSLGSGKSFITLDYVEKNPGKKVIIFLPEFLKANKFTSSFIGIQDPIHEFKNPDSSGTVAA